MGVRLLSVLGANVTGMVEIDISKAPRPPPPTCVHAASQRQCVAAKCKSINPLGTPPSVHAALRRPADNPSPAFLHCTSGKEVLYPLVQQNFVGNIFFLSVNHKKEM